MNEEYAPSLSSISPNRLSGMRICEDIIGSLTHLHFNMSYVAGEKILVLPIQSYCTQHHSDLSFPVSYLPSILSACP